MRRCSEVIFAPVVWCARGRYRLHQREILAQPQAVKGLTPSNSPRAYQLTRVRTHDEATSYTPIGREFTPITETSVAGGRGIDGVPYSRETGENGGKSAADSNFSAIHHE